MCTGGVGVCVIDGRVVGAAPPPRPPGGGAARRGALAGGLHRLPLPAVLPHLSAAGANLPHAAAAGAVLPHPSP